MVIEVQMSIQEEEAIEAQTQEIRDMIRHAAREVTAALTIIEGGEMKALDVIMADEAPIGAMKRWTEITAEETMKSEEVAMMNVEIIVEEMIMAMTGIIRRRDRDITRKIEMKRKDDIPTQRSLNTTNQSQVGLSRQAAEEVAARQAVYARCLWTK